MSLGIIKTILVKDLILFFKNRFIFVITILGLIFYIIAYFLTPKTINETMRVGIYSSALPPIFQMIQEVEGSGLKIEHFPGEEGLRESVLKGKISAGISLPSDFMEKIASGEKTLVKVYLPFNVSVEIRDGVELMLKEIVFMQIGKPLPVEVKEEIVGQDMVGRQIPPRQRLVPLFALFLLTSETFGLANLISEEIEKQTIQALLVTPVTIPDIFISKGIIGTGLAFTQAVLLLLITGGFKYQPLLILLILLCGSLLVTGVGFIIGSFAKGMMSVLTWGSVMFLILVIPSFNILFLGTITTDWVKIIPTYYLSDILHKLINFSSEFKDVYGNILILLFYSIVLMFSGVFILRRRYQ